MIYLGERQVHPEKFLYSQKEAAAAVALSRRSIEYYIARGELQTRRIGRRVMVTRDSLRRFAEKNHLEPIHGQPTSRVATVAG
jgi:excisionase family DNA binding protein